MLMQAIVAGGCASGGLVLAWWGWQRRPPRLAAALDVVDGLAPTSGLTWREPRRRTAQLLASKGRTLADLQREQLLLGAVFGVCGLLAGAAWFSVGGPAWSIGALLLAGALLGAAYPALVLRWESSTSTSEATWAMFTFLDLVVLERLANRSAAGALMAAAQACENPVFVRLRAALENAQLASQSPAHALRTAAVDLGLPGLASVADIVDMESSGASLVDALRSQVSELRHAHTSEQLARAHADTERLAIPMVLPVIVFALIFLTPPLLRLAGL